LKNYLFLPESLLQESCVLPDGLVADLIFKSRVFWETFVYYATVVKVSMLGIDDGLTHF
jgi:nicotinamide mononucleotide (NMN) deamidase PncC